MPKPTKGPRLGGSPTHERIILRNMATQLFEHGRITTTETKARRLQPFAEKLISKAKRGDLHARRLVLQSVTDVDVVHKLFTEIAPSLADREGGYTRITKLGPRKGDNAPMAAIEIVTESVEESRATRAKSPRAKVSAAPTAPARKQKGASAAAPVAESPTDETKETPVETDTADVQTEEAAVTEAAVEPEAAESEMIDETGAPEVAAADEIADDARVDEAADVAAPAAEVAPEEEAVEPTADAADADEKA